jgi:predicted lipid-binding transport protein (Tim44 family)
MQRAITTSVLLALATSASVTSIPLAAQPTAAASANPRQCAADTPQKKAKRGMFGAMMGSMAGAFLGSAGGVAGTVASVALPAASMLGEELLRLLDCKEQQQAAKATDDAIRGGVGTEVKWTSESRANVTGRSRVTGEQKLADGGQCFTVSDVVIVDGEETTVPKKMCRARGASGYAKV